MKEYRILKSTYYDEYGKEQNEYHYVQQRKSFLGFKYWKNITHEDFGPGGVTRVTTTFDSYFDAYEFVVKLKTGMKVNEHKVETVSEL
jgi:hypothetical protein